jgi:hypothetical protein
MYRLLFLTWVFIVGCEVHQVGTESGNPPKSGIPILGNSSSANIIDACETDDECTKNAEDSSYLEQLGKPRESWTQYERSYCGRVKTDVSGGYYFDSGQGDPSCLCIYREMEDNVEVYRGDLLSPLVASECLVFGRFQRCIFSKYEFPGCDFAKPFKSCEPICSELETRNKQDAQRDADVSPRLGKCLERDNDLGIGVCHEILKVDGTCYATFPPYFEKTINPLDCSLTDDQLVSQVQGKFNTSWTQNVNLPVYWDDSGNNEVLQVDIEW